MGGVELADRGVDRVRCQGSAKSSARSHPLTGDDRVRVQQERAEGGLLRQPHGGRDSDAGLARVLGHDSGAAHRIGRHRTPPVAVPPAARCVAVPVIAVSVSTKGELVDVEAVVDQVGAGGQLPQPCAARQHRDHLALRDGQAQRSGSSSELVGFLPVDDAGRAVGEQSVGDRAPGGAGRGDGVEIGQAVQDQQVGDAVGARQLPLRLHPPQQRGAAQQPPRLVVHHPPRAGLVARSGEGLLQPRRRARHRDGQGGVVGSERGQIQHHHRRGRVETVGGRAVEHAGEVAAGQAAQRMHEVGAVAGPGGDGGAGPRSRDQVRVGQGVDEPRQRRGGVRTDGVECGVRGRCARPGARSRPRRVAATAARTVALEFMEPRDAGGASRGLSRVDRPGPIRMTVPPTASASGAPFALGVAGDVDAPPGGERAQREGLGQRGLALTDDPGQEHVRVGQLPFCVEGPGVERERLTGERIRPDVDPGLRRSRGQEGVGAGQDGAAGPVGRDPQRPQPRPAPRHPGAGGAVRAGVHRIPRASGRAAAVCAAACCPARGRSSHIARAAAASVARHASTRAVLVGGGDGDQAGEAQVAVAGDQVALAGGDVVGFGAGGLVLDAARCGRGARSPRRGRPARGGCPAPPCAAVRGSAISVTGAVRAGCQQQRLQELDAHLGAGPLRDPVRGVHCGVGAQMRPRLRNGHRPPHPGPVRLPLSGRRDQRRSVPWGRRRGASARTAGEDRSSPRP